MANKQHLRKLLSDAIPVLCRNGLPPSVTFRVEALIGITVINDDGRDAVGEGNVTVLSFQQTVSDAGVVTSQFGSNDPVAALPDVGSSVSHTPQKRRVPKQVPTATVSVKHEYSVESSVKQEYDVDSYPPPPGHPLDPNTYEEYGTADGEEVEYLGDDGEYAEEEEYYDYDDSSGYLPDVKFETQDDAYMEGGGDGSYMQTQYMTDDYGQSSAGRPPKYKAPKPRLSSAGTQPTPSKVRKTSGTARGGTRPRAGRASHDQATAVAVRYLGATGYDHNSLCLFCDLFSILARRQS